MFKKYVVEPFSPRVGWMTYRIVDEILKRAYIKRMCDLYSPIDLKSLGIKVKPSPHVVAAYTNYDTF